MEQQIQLEEALKNIQKLVDNIEKVIRGKERKSSLSHARLQKVIFLWKIIPARVKR